MLTCSYSIFIPVLYLTKYTCSWPDNWRTVNFFALRKPLQYALGHKPFGWIWAESITLYTSQILLLLSAVTSSVNIIAFIPLAAIQPMYSLCQFFQVLHVRTWQQINIKFSPGLKFTPHDSTAFSTTFSSYINCLLYVFFSLSRHYRGILAPSSL